MQYSPGSIPTRGTTPLPSEGLLTWIYLLTCTLSIPKRTSAWKHIAHPPWSPWPAKPQTRKIQETHLRIEQKATKIPKSNTHLGPLQTRITSTWLQWPANYTHNKVHKPRTTVSTQCHNQTDGQKRRINIAPSVYWLTIEVPHRPWLY